MLIHTAVDENCNQVEQGSNCQLSQLVAGLISDAPQLMGKELQP